jgi:3-oxoacyl-(acyl-carrier-protein) synthase
MATINPLGDTLEEYYQNLISGKSGIKVWHTVDISNVACKIGGDVGDYDFAKALEDLRGKVSEERHKRLRKLFRTMTVSNKSATICSLNAYIDAGLFDVEIDPYRVSVITGGHNVNSKYVHQQAKQYAEEPEWIDPLYGIECIDPNIPGTISEALGVQGPAFNVGAACASGNIALRDGFRDIITGECDASVINGAFWDMDDFDIFAMAFLNSLVTEPEFQKNPEIASRPFDVRRCGFVPSHGAGALIIEDLEHAKRRGAKIYAEVLGVCANSNANHLPAPSEEAQAALMKNLLKTCDVKPEEVGFVGCHATGTPLGDLKELNAIKKAFGNHVYNMKFNAPKSMLGHTAWSAPIVETIAGVMQMLNRKLHPSTNIDELAPEVDVDVCKDGAVDYDFDIMLKNSFGFGGLNCCSLIKRYEE